MGGSSAGQAGKTKKGLAATFEEGEGRKVSLKVKPLWVHSQGQMAKETSP